MRERTLELIEAARSVLEANNPMTLRQVYYQLVAAHILENCRSEYQRLSGALVKGRQEGIVPWEWIEDRTRRPRDVSMWRDVQDFMNTVRLAYRRDVWARQPRYVVLWVEKDALSAVFEDIAADYGMTVVVGRGYNSWSVRRELADRFVDLGKEDRAVVLYFGDFDPSGEDIFRDLAEGFEVFGIYPTLKKVALTRQDVLDHDLPPDFTKKTDSRSRRFVERHGDMAVELDALPLQVLRNKIRDAIEEHMDMEALELVRRQEAAERRKIERLTERLE